MSNRTGSQTTDDQTTRAIDQIAHIRDAHARAEAEGTFDPVLDHVAEDLVVAMPGHAPIEGRDAWAEKFNELMAGAPDREYEITYESAETLVSDDLAIDRGTCVDTAVGEDGDQLQTEYNYLMVFQRTAEGSWKQTRTIWNEIG